MFLKQTGQAFVRNDVSTNVPTFGQGVNETTFGCCFLVLLSIIAMIYEAQSRPGPAFVPICIAEKLAYCVSNSLPAINLKLIILLFLHVRLIGYIAWSAYPFWMALVVCLQSLSYLFLLNFSMMWNLSE